MDKKSKSIVAKATDTAKGALATVGGTVTKNPQTALYVGVGIVSVIAIYMISKQLNKIGDFNLGNEEGAGGGNSDPNSGNSVPYGATISNNEAENIASGLYEATMQWGTDEEKVISLLAGKNTKDFAMISRAFGKPRYDGVAEAFWPIPERPLTFILNSELSGTDLQRLRQVMPGVL